MTARLEQKARAHNLEAPVLQRLTGRIGESTVANHGSCESTVDVTEDTGGDRDDNDSGLDLPTLEDLFSEAKAKRRITSCFEHQNSEPVPYDVDNACLAAFRWRAWVAVNH